MTLSLLEDDRFLLKAPELWSEMQEEATFIEHLPDLVYDSLARLVSDPDCSGGDIRHDTIWAMRTSIAYVDRNLFSATRSLPLSVTQGDIKANLLALREQGAMELDHVSRKIHCCSSSCPRQA